MVKKRSRLILAFIILLLPLWILRKIRLLEITLILGLGFYYGWRLGSGRLNIHEVYFLGIPAWVEIVFAALVAVILGLKVMLSARERAKIT